jgi:Fic family protein
MTQDDRRMKNVKPIWEPQYRVTTDMVRCLMDIEAIRTTVGQTALPTAVEVKLRHQARLHSTHYSTRIEGNRLTLAEAEQVIQDRKAGFRGRERDVLEVKYYWDALLKVEAWAAIKRPLTENLIRRLHGWVEHGPRSRPTPFRDGQNVIRDSSTGAIVYMPPEASDVPRLMKELINGVSWAEKTGAPVPLVAGLFHYQFVTIHPYHDGNGRTARLLATFILQRGGYGLQGLFSLEEFHARDLTAYYRALATHPHHNYYEGRANADLTPWMNYFLSTLAGAFGEVRDSITLTCRADPDRRTGVHPSSGSPFKDRPLAVRQPGNGYERSGCPGSGVLRADGAGPDQGMGGYGNAGHDGGGQAQPGLRFIGNT